MIYISLLFWVLAAICNSIMDVIAHHWSDSIFRLKFVNKFSSSFKLWCYEFFHKDGWKNKYVNHNPKQGRVKWFWNITKPVQITDAWHFFKMLMIIFMAVSVLTFPHHLCNAIGYVIWLLLLGILWNSIFSLFYDVVLKK